MAAAALLSLRAPLGLDYEGGSTTGTDSAAPQIDALIAGHLHRFVSPQAAQGPVSLVLRAPFAAVAGSGHQLARYRLGVFACLLALGLASLLVARAMGRRGAGRREQVFVAGLILLGPAVFDSVKFGHPEDLLATALLIAAAFAAAASSVALAAIACGLAIATKATALLALVPVALAACSARVRVGLATVAVAAVAIAPVALASPGSFRRAVRFANESSLIHPADIWWPLSSRTRLVSDGVTLRRVRAPYVPGVVHHAVRPFLIALAAGLALLAARRRELDLADVFLALALVMLLRCVLDPGDNRYYHAPFAIFLACWEGLRHGRLPVIALAAAGLTATVPSAFGPHRDLVSLLYLAWALPASAWMAWELLRRPTRRGLAPL